MVVYATCFMFLKDYSKGKGLHTSIICIVWHRNTCFCLTYVCANMFFVVVPCNIVPCKLVLCVCAAWLTEYNVLIRKPRKIGGGSPMSPFRRPSAWPCDLPVVLLSPGRSADTLSHVLLPLSFWLSWPVLWSLKNWNGKLKTLINNSPSRSTVLLWQAMGVFVEELITLSDTGIICAHTKININAHLIKILE